MGRRRRSDADTLIEIISSCPWWVGVALAIISFLVLNHFAQPSLVPDPPRGIEQMGEFTRDTLLRTFASLGRVVVPVICVMGAVASLVLGRRRTSLHEKARNGGLAAVAEMGWKDFERLTHELFRRQGYAVLESRRGPDGGIDLQLQKDGQLTLVQCKHWKGDVGVKVVRELYGVVAARKARGGIVVSSSGYSAEARRFAESAGVKLIDGAMLERDVGYIGPDAPPTLERAATAEQRCPTCGSEMVVRTARKGATAGTQFLGCKRYPECRGTRQLA